MPSEQTEVRVNLRLMLTLLSDTTFGRGDGVAGLVDEEVEHDAATGLPTIRGRVLKGLLTEECANLLFALDRANPAAARRGRAAAEALFGRPGSRLNDDGALRLGTATLPDELCRAVEAGVLAERLQPTASEVMGLKPTDVLASITDIRRQTATDFATGAPKRNSLRNMRVVLRQTLFSAPLDVRFPDERAQSDGLALLAACVLALRRGGMGRNRGRGRIQARLHDAGGADITAQHFARFTAWLGGEA